MDQNNPAAAATAVRPLRTRTGDVQWRLFLRAMADQIDHMAGLDERDDMLRGVGRRMARMIPLPPVLTLPSLEIEVNEALEQIGWGAATLRLDEADRALVIHHTGLPRVGSIGVPSGQWLSALLEGLYETWFVQQPGSQPSLSATRVVTHSPDAVTLRFARA